MLAIYPCNDAGFSCLKTFNLITLIIYVTLCAAEYWKLRKADRKYLESNIRWTDRVRNKELFNRVKEERNIVQTTKRKKAKGIGHILYRNCLLKHVIEGKIEVKERRGRICKQLLDDVKETREYWALIGEVLVRTQWCNSLLKRLWTCRKANYSMNELTLILRRSRTGTVWFYTSTSNRRAARPKLYTKSLTRDLKLMYSRLTLVRISINL